MSVLLPVRIVLFYTLLGLTAFVWCLISLVVAPFMSFRMRYRFINQAWCRCAIWLAERLSDSIIRLAVRKMYQPGPA